MKIIRRGVFETNSSSLHALTVPEDLYDSWQLIHDYVSKDLERFKVGENSYNIVFDVNDKNMDGEDFSIRRYIPHYSVVDKAFYAIATIAEHYGSLLAKNMPYDSSTYEYKWAEREKDPEKKQQEIKKADEAHAKFLVAREEYIKAHGAANKKVLEDFKKEIKDLEEQLAYNFREYLNNRPRREDPEDWRKNEDWEEYINSCPDVKVTIKYYVLDEEMGLFTIVGEDEDFNTGCYDNEEFYYAVCRDEYSLSRWLSNPFAAVLAGSDEQGMLDSYKQEEEANRLLEEAWQHVSPFESTYPDLTDEEIEEEVEEHCYTWDDSPMAQAQLKEEKNELREFLKSHRGKKKPVHGKIIWPIGG